MELFRARPGEKGHRKHMEKRETIVYSTSLFSLSPLLTLGYLTASDSGTVICNHHQWSLEAIKMGTFT